MIPTALYIHYPWCVQKCPYCDFNSHVSSQTDIYDIYVDALISDLEFKLEFHGTESLHSIFIGGGTPSLIPGGHLSRLIDAIKKRVVVPPGCEITMEANPGTLDSANFEAYLNAGVNRLSVGIQSFSNAQLATLGRIHSAKKAIETIQHAQEIGFKNINIDLMYGLAQQSIKDAISDLSQAIDLQPTHLSTYQLTIEPNTHFKIQPPKGLPENDYSHDMQIALNELLSSSGYEQYEVSAHAKDNHFCQHNLNYWLFGDYIAIGAGAHGKHSDLRKSATGINRITRYVNFKKPQKYIDTYQQQLRSVRDGKIRLKPKTDDPYIQKINEVITIEEIRFEFLMNALRLKRGLSSQLVEERTLESSSALCEFIQSKGLLDQILFEEVETTPILRIRASDHAYLHLDDVLSRFL